MMSRAGRVHLRRWGILTACVLAMALTAQRVVTDRYQERVKAAIDAAQNNLVTAVLDALCELQKLPRSATLREIKSRSAVSDVSQRLRLAFAEAELGQPDVEFLCSQIGGLSWDGNLITLAATARNLNDTALRSALCMSLAIIPAERITVEAKVTWQPLFTE